MWKKAVPAVALSAFLLVGCNNDNNGVPDDNETPMQDVQEGVDEITPDMDNNNNNGTNGNGMGGTNTNNDNDLDLDDGVDHGDDGEIGENDNNDNNNNNGLNGNNGNNGNNMDGIINDKDQ
ncbi:hypothetical protein PGC35_02760 [Psychrobacillus sp. PGGUH221]|uniref:hypothetical protein n=1 Tax=Psychrobacillus sp. PGGUH221 TaxID=3020058 RepID=UPI0035C69E08